MPAVYEFGARKRIDVVKATPNDVEPPQWDISAWIKEFNELKSVTPVFCEEGSWTALTDYEKDVMFLKKQSDGNAKPVLVCVNKNMEAQQEVGAEDIPEEAASFRRMLRVLTCPFRESAVPRTLSLKPAEIVVFTC